MNTSTRLFSFRGPALALVLIALFASGIASTLKLNPLHPFAQTDTVCLTGTVTDYQGEGIPFANVAVYQANTLIAGSATDFDGKYFIGGLAPGTYTVEASFAGNRSRVTNIEVLQDTVVVDLTMSADIQLERVALKYEMPLLDAENTTTGGVVTKEDIRNMPSRNVQSLSTTQAGVYQSDEGAGLNIRGSRGDATEYVIDGVRVSGSLNLPQNAVEQIQIITGGVDASYGYSIAEGDVFDAVTVALNKPKQKKQADVVHNTEAYDPIVENQFLETMGNPLSTFSIDVDAASYANVRRYLDYGQQPPADAVRTEELINYFTYDYPRPSGEHPFSVVTEISETPWNSETRLIHIGLQGKDIDRENLQPSNLVFLLDVSGSMEAANKLSLVKSSLLKLVDQLGPQDRVAIVVYAGAAGEVLPSTAASQKQTIRQALTQLSAGGSTAGGAGIQLAYSIAEKNLRKDGNNRVILCTDGDFNVGVSSDAEMVRLIEEKRKSGIFLTVCGFGMGNYKDSKLEKIADAGNGNYFYIDREQEADKVFITEMRGTLFTIAKDVKLQVEFNPTVVKSYRLIGYENRMLAKEDFADDTKDAGELGAGHTVTALYEVVLFPPAERLLQGDQQQQKYTQPVQPVEELRYQQTTIKREAYHSDEILTLSLRYKKPDEATSRLIVHPLRDERTPLQASSDNFRWSAAVAAYGLVLRNSEHKGSADLELVHKLASGAKGADLEGYRADFLKMVQDSRKVLAVR
jgi:Ca-activated chloride channel family protein